MFEDCNLKWKNLKLEGTFVVEPRHVSCVYRGTILLGNIMLVRTPYPVPSKCTHCDYFCHTSIYECNPSYCTAAESFIILLFGTSLIIIIIRLFQFYRARQRQSALKKS